jgi:hypothetical protein
MKSSWFCCCSYFQQHAKERNIINILVKQDQFPTLKQVQETLEEKLGFAVEDVVLMNWKEVNENYKI